MPPPDSINETAAVQNVYFNGFSLGLSNADVSGLLTQGGQPVVSLSMSYTTAKTLSVALADIIKTLEKVTKRDIMTITDVSEGLQKLSAGEDGENVH